LSSSGCSGFREVLTSHSLPLRTGCRTSTPYGRPKASAGRRRRHRSTSQGDQPSTLNREVSAVATDLRMGIFYRRGPSACSCGLSTPALLHYNDADDVQHRDRVGGRSGCYPRGGGS
jgi:hypothetical protein